MGERTHGIHVSTLQRRYNSVTLATQWEAEGEFEPTLRAEQIPCVVLGKELPIFPAFSFILQLHSDLAFLCSISVSLYLLLTTVAVSVIILFGLQYVMYPLWMLKVFLILLDF